MTRIHVAVAVIQNDQGEVLIAQRPAHKHQGGLWEFPGGKVEVGEDLPSALKRELQEELGITAARLQPLMRIDHDYPDKSVLLDVWRVGGIDGVAHGKEGQPVRWVPANELRNYAFPAANVSIISAILLPPLYLITGEIGRLDSGPTRASIRAADEKVFLGRIEQAARAGARLMQLRVKSLDDVQYRALAQRALAICHRYGAQLLLNAEPRLVLELDAGGVHLTSTRLMALRARPLPRQKWVAASCHNPDEIRHACAIGVDFIVLAPVLATGSHPGVAPLGWDRFQELAEHAQVPVYALGGMNAAHLALVRQRGAQGVAVVSAVWEAADVVRAVGDFLNRSP